MAEYRYGYDNLGNRTFLQRAHEAGAPTDVYVYDGLNQLTEVWYGADATEPAAITNFERVQSSTLDSLGNRLTMDDDGTTVHYLPNNGQQLTNPMHRYEQVDGAALDYDLTGNLLTDGSNTYSYDVFNRQISMIGLDSTAEYVYDALGRRVAKIVDGVTTYDVYNASYQVIEERDGSNQLLARYTYGAGIDEPLTMERGGQTYYYHRDALGSITEITDASGALVERYEYDVYGAVKIFDNSGNPLTASAIGNPYLFTGRRYDPESGNYYYRARMYSPTLGRFLQTDPLGYVDGLNLYAYVRNNPVAYADPFGYARSDYVVNADGSVTFVGRGATIWEAVTLFDELGYSTWQEGVERFAQDYDAADWWRDDGSWTGKRGASLIGKTLPGKKPPSVPPEFIEPAPSSCDPDDTMPPGFWSRPSTNLPLPQGPWNRPPAKPCDPALGYDYYARRGQRDCASRMKPEQISKIIKQVNEESDFLKKIDDCANNPPKWWGDRQERIRWWECVSSGSKY